MVVHIYNTSTLEVEAGGLGIRGQSGLHSENLLKRKEKKTKRGSVGLGA
jgi:hypothetical protein